MDASHRLVSQLSAALGRGAAYVDLADALRGLVLDGQLVVGEQLPAERTLAAALGLSRTTVTAALTVLRAEGYLVSRQGSGTVVRLPTERVDRPDEPAAAGHVPIDLTVATLPAPRQVAPAAERAAARLAGLLSGQGLHPLGLPDLRRRLARRMTEAGLATHPDQLLITQGALHAWDLVLRAYARPGSRVLIEQPSYAAAIDTVRAHHARTQLLPVDADGWRWPRRAATPDIAYVIPDFHNPTGHLAGRAARRDLLRALRGSLVCVDETFAELAYDTRPTPLAALGKGVVTAGTLSKLVWAGLRVGWLRAPRDVITRVAVARSSQDLATPVLDQLLALELADDLDEIVTARRAMLVPRRDHAVDFVRRAGWQVTPPSGGLFLWTDLGDTSSTHLAQAARAAGVRVTPGTRFSVTGTHDRFLRLPFCHPPDVLADAMGRLAGAATVRGARHTTAAARWTV